MLHPPVPYGPYFLWAFGQTGLPPSQGEGENPSPEIATVGWACWELCSVVHTELLLFLHHQGAGVASEASGVVVPLCNTASSGEETGP